MVKRGVTRREFVVGGALVALSVQGRRLFGQSAEAVNAALIQTPLGALRGEVIDGVRVFRGVPFAEPPVGALRFKPPVKVKPWVEEREASRFRAEAMQDGDRDVSKSEDCLYLNVWTMPDAEALPVFVWIHGGGFTGGSSFAPVFDGTEFAKAGVVVVTVAYRLGVFGFLEMEPLLGAEYAGSGNNAVQDLICALEWVRDNIEAFGGDPKRVTVGGESAGAKLTDVLMGVPKAQGLFAQMISESGGAERVWPKANAEAVARGFGEAWGKGVEHLKTAPAGELISAQVRFVASWPQHFPLRMEVDGSLIPRLPVETIAGGTWSGTRLLIGTNRDESALFVGAHPQKVTAADLGNVPLAQFEEVFARYRAVYPTMSEEQLRIRALTAEEYWVPSVRVADAYLKGGGAAWMYRLDFAPASGRLKGEAYHSEDIGLVWDKVNEDITNVAAERALAKQMHAAWVAFIKGETPGAEGLPLWPQYTSDTRETMVFDKVNRVETRPEEAELRLWDGVM
ncbi:MAG TPA: carboxylesterase family protein [Acidobacteriaceae bacterium]|nr:carboxylesterase family protein [Acidobacteriaceae bacterium]